MGAGAAAGLTTALGTVSDGELRDALKQMPRDARDKVCQTLQVQDATTITQTEVSSELDNALMDFFQLYDMDSGGFITIDEYLAVSRELQKACGEEFDEEETRSRFKDTDTNKDGKVACSEFMDHLKAQAKTLGIPDAIILVKLKSSISALQGGKATITLNDALTAMFEIYDIDKSGFVTIDEMVAVDKVFAEACTTPFNEEETRSNFSESDANKDGKVTLEEFIAYYKATAEKAGLTEDSLLGMVSQTNDVLIKNKGM